jgi:hypothetical protein
MKEAEKAFKEYEKAVATLYQLLDKYFPVRRVFPGEPPPLEEPVTEEVIKEVQKAEVKVNKALNKWADLMGL